MQNLLFKKFDYYWFFVILTFILSYGFFLTNHSMGIDDNILNIFGSKIAIVASNRSANFIFSNSIIPCEYLPFWREFLGLFFYVIGVTLHAENFIKYINFDKKLATIFTCLAISFPYLAFHFIFLEEVMQHGLIMISTAFAVKYFYQFFVQEKTKSNFILMFISLLFATSLYESALYYFAIACFIIEFFKFLFDKNEKFYNRVFYIGCFSFLSVTLNILFCEILKKIMNIKYSKFDEFLKYDTSSVSEFFKSFVGIQKEFLHKFITTCEYNFGSVIALFCIILLLIYALVQTFKKKNFNILFCALLIILVPFASLLLLGNVDMQYRSYTTLSFLVAIVFVLLFHLCKEKRFLNKVIIGFVSLVVILNSQELTQIFYTENIKVENDKQFAYSVMYDLQKLGFENRPIIWVGVKNNPMLKHCYEESKEINISSFNWDRYISFENEVHIMRTYAFLKELGMEIKGYYDLNISSQEEYDTFIEELKQASKEMTIYPKEGSIKDNGEYVIIKIGDSKADIE